MTGPVAGIDCSEVDMDELARIAGGSDHLTLVEVPYTYKQVSEHCDRLAGELRDDGIRADVPIGSGASRRSIEVRVRDRKELPADFGATVPDDIYPIVETDDLSEEGSLADGRGQKDLRKDVPPAAANFMYQRHGRKRITCRSEPSTKKRAIPKRFAHALIRSCEIPGLDSFWTPWGGGARVAAIEPPSAFAASSGL